jgi:hypothetical protein
MRRRFDKGIRPLRDNDRPDVGSSTLIAPSRSAAFYTAVNTVCHTPAGVIAFRGNDATDFYICHSVFN